jgi:hypothetical protein
LQGKPRSERLKFQNNPKNDLQKTKQRVIQPLVGYERKLSLRLMVWICYFVFLGTKFLSFCLMWGKTSLSFFDKLLYFRPILKKLESLTQTVIAKENGKLSLKPLNFVDSGMFRKHDYFERNLLCNPTRLKQNQHKQK